MRFVIPRYLRIGLLAATVLFAALPAADTIAQTNEVDVQLVLAVDISGSMDATEQRAQREGYVQAFRNPDVQRAIVNGLLGRIAVTYVGWAGADTQIVFVPWTLIDSKAAADNFADRLGRVPLGTFRGTSISQALIFSAGLFGKSGYSSARRTIDISGDGPNNNGIAVERARAAVLAGGVTINGLPLILPGHDASSTLDLDIYYKNCVIGGPGAFHFTVTKIEEFPTAIRRKLIQEIADYEAPQSPLVPAQAQSQSFCPERPLFFQP